MDARASETSPAAPEFDLELRGKTRRSIGWTITRTLSDQLFSFTVFVVLAQLLTREEIGIFAMAYVFAEIGRIVATSGLSQLIARAERIEQKLVDTVFWTNLGVALVYALLLAAAAPFLADLLNQPSAARPLQVLPFAAGINALDASNRALRLRALGPRTIAFRSLLAGLIGGGGARPASLACFRGWAAGVRA